MPSRPTSDLRKIKSSFFGKKEEAEMNSPEDTAPAKKYNSFGAEMEDEEEPLPEGAPLKDRVTRSILSILRKKGPPKAE
jgi:hypothetical protein